MDDLCSGWLKHWGSLLEGVPRIMAILRSYRDNGKENGNYYRTLRSYRDNGKENGNYYLTLRSYRDNGKENGNYYNGLYRVIQGCIGDNGKENRSYDMIGLYKSFHIGIMEKKMETTIVYWVI